MKLEARNIVVHTDQSLTSVRGSHSEELIMISILANINFQDRPFYILADSRLSILFSLTDPSLSLTKTG